MKTSLSTIASLVLITSLSANNVEITNVTNSGVNVTFDMTWENSWNLGVGSTVGDGVWVVVKQAQLKYYGGDGCGASIESTTGVANYSYRGGDDDGYSHILFRTPFIWTGAVGTSWTVSGNWNYNLIPGIFRPVIIPAGVPNWPYVNAGLFAIGDNPNGSNYRCASLWIQENAFLQTRIDCRIENYGLVTIDGEMRVKKITANAFQNFATGVVIVNQGGELKVRP